MAVQVLYPVGSDNTVNGFVTRASGTADLWASVDNGVSTPDDTDYLICKTANFPIHNSYWGGAGGNRALYLDFGPILVRPESVKLRLRLAGDSGLTYRIGITDLGDNPVSILWGSQRLDNFNPINQTIASRYDDVSIEVNSTSFANYEFNLDEAAISQDLTEQDLYRTRLYVVFEHVSGDDDNATAKISEVELIVSGEPLGLNNVDLFIPGGVVFCDNQNLMPSGKYSTATWRVRGNYDIEDKFDLGFWPVNEGSGNVIYDLTGTRSGVYTNGTANGRWVDFYKQGEIDIAGTQQPDQSKYDYGLQLGPGYIEFNNSTLAPTGDFTLYFRVAPSGITNDAPPEFRQFTPIFTRESGLSVIQDFFTEFQLYDFQAAAYNTNGQAFTVSTDSGGDLPQDPWPQAYVVTYGPDRCLRAYTDFGGNFLTMQVIGSSNPFDRAYHPDGITRLGAFNDADGNIRTANLFIYEFGMASRAFSFEEADEILQSVVQPSLYVNEDPDEVFPFPSGGTDTTYVEWSRIHPVSGGATDEFEALLRPWFGDRVYQIDGPYQTDLFGEVRLHSPDAIRVNMWVENLSDIDMGIRPVFRLEGDNVPTWVGHRVSVPSGLHYVSISGYYGIISEGDTPILVSNMDRNEEATFTLYASPEDDSDFTHTFRVYSAKFDFDAWCIPATGTGIIDLYVSGSPPNESLDLYILGGLKESGNLDLYINGVGAVNDLDLFMHGYDTDSGVFTMFIESRLEESGRFPLYIRGIFEDDAELPLFLKARDPQPDNDSLELYLWATDNSGLFTYTTLYIKSDEETGNPDGDMNLVIAGYGAFDLTSNLNLFIKTDGNEDGSLNISKNIELFIKNGYVQQTGAFDLFMNAPSGTDGAIPISGSMPLFINRLYDSIANQMDLFINGPSGINNELTLYLNAQPSATGLLEAYIKGIGTSNSDVTTYIHGF